MPIHLDAQGLEAYLPHRGVNLIPDSVTLADDLLSAESRTTISSGDARGRELLGRSGSWQEPYIAELMALTGVPLLNERHQDGAVGVFSAMSNARFHSLADLDREVVGTARIHRDRGSFTQFKGELRQDSKLIYEAEIMSCSAQFGAIAAVSAQGGGLPDGQPLSAAFGWKPKPTVFIDRVLEVDMENGRLVAGYRYGEAHPFRPGHFPDAALMMGVSQWAAVADAAWELKARLGLDCSLQIDGEISRADGGGVMSVRDLHIEMANGQPQIRRCKRVAFRDVVRPGDALRVSVALVK